jgi:hypothetical protein
MHPLPEEGKWRRSAGWDHNPGIRFRGGPAMEYVDGFVVPVPKQNLAAYKKMSLVFNPKALPFDGERMFFGGFKIFIEE